MTDYKPSPVAVAFARSALRGGLVLRLRRLFGLDERKREPPEDVLRSVIGNAFSRAFHDSHQLTTPTPQLMSVLSMHERLLWLFHWQLTGFYGFGERDATRLAAMLYEEVLQQARSGPVHLNGMSASVHGDAWTFELVE